MRKTVLLGLSSIFMLGVLFSVGSLQHAYAQDETPTLYDDDSFIDPYEDDFYTTTDAELSDSDVEDLIAVIMGQMFFIACFGIPVYIYISFSLMTIGNKVGEDNSWFAWIPILNQYYMVKVGDMAGWMFLLYFVPFVNFFFAIYVWMKIAERRGFPSWYGLLLLVPLVNIAIPGYLAFADSGSGSSSSTSSNEKEMTLEEHEAKSAEKPMAEEPASEKQEE